MEWKGATRPTACCLLTPSAQANVHLFCTAASADTASLTGLSAFSSAAGKMGGQPKLASSALSLFAAACTTTHEGAAVRICLRGVMMYRKPPFSLTLLSGRDYMGL